MELTETVATADSSDTPEQRFDFEKYLETGAGKLTGYCAAMVGPADAEDAAQEAYFRLWKNLRKLPNEAAANAYLYKTAYRICIDLLRARKRFREPERPTDHDRLSLSDGMTAALRTLSPADRAVVWGRIVEEESYAEIAAKFGKSEAWARKRMSLARKRLAAALGTPAAARESGTEKEESR